MDNLKIPGSSIIDEAVILVINPKIEFSVSPYGEFLSFGDLEDGALSDSRNEGIAVQSWRGPLASKGFLVCNAGFFSERGPVLTSVRNADRPADICDTEHPFMENDPGVSPGIAACNGHPCSRFGDSSAGELEYSTQIQDQEQDGDGREWN
ncbi:hypothetical protein ACFCZ1_20920 [Streptomyces sp. NPDC056224]|uniref:hypothetical protein n=1 Tax=Streptomyces sp. NPDC056224 TaxID=3345750 RepID=UPI0035DAF5F0